METKQTLNFFFLFEYRRFSSIVSKTKSAELMENHSQLNFRNLLDDNSFIQWVLHPTPELMCYWEQQMENDERLRKDIVTLKNILENLQVKEPEISNDNKELIWHKIELQIDQSQHKKKKIRSFIIWSSSIAASFLILFGGYSLLNRINDIREVDYSQFTSEKHDMMNTENINLILSDNKRINIDKDSTVITYNPDGIVNIDSEKVEEQVIKPDVPELNQLVVPYGKTTSLVLSDGTKIWVNSGSHLVYPAVFDKNKREIFLSGEAFIDVTRNEKLPFIVKTNDIELNVLGTSFNISAYNDDAIQSVVLVTGSVEVKSNNLKGKYRIEPDQMLSYSKEANKIDIQQVDVANYISWVHGYLLTQHEELHIVLQKLSRHFNIIFDYDKERLNRITVSGKLDLRLNVEEILNNISLTTPIKYTSREGHILIERI